MVDNIAVGGAPANRLIRIDAAHGTAEVIASWRMPPSFRDTYALSVSNDGWPLLAIGRRNNTKVFKLRVSPQQGLHVHGVDVVQGSLAIPPVVDENGITYVKPLPNGALTLERRPRNPNDNDDATGTDDRGWIGQFF